MTVIFSIQRLQQFVFSSFVQVILSQLIIIEYLKTDVDLVEMADIKQTTIDLGLLEEDDEFEEFPKDEVESEDQDQSDIKIWEDKWDDDDTAQVKVKHFGYKLIIQCKPRLVIKHS
jgi:hypothetical protein